jgi:acyl-CoA reductase-like NAD-dependent aldehyde dehydrogenase
MGLVRTELFVGGVHQSADSYMSVLDPARPHVVVGRAAAASAEQAAAAVAAAADAFPAWSHRSAQDRADALLAAIAGHDEIVMDTARILSLENGKVFGECVGDVLAIAELFEQTAALAPQVEEIVRYSGPPFDTTVARIPLGVVTIIVPFNWPLAILGASLPQALIAGNTVVVKPPPSAPLAVVRVVERLAALLPAGVVNIITGEDQVIGGPLIQNSLVAKVCFTGSVAGGSRIMAMAAQTLTRVALELGGNDPILILDDAELDDASLDRLFGSVFASTGQICMAGKRLYVHRSRYSEIVEGLSDRLSRVVIGHGVDPATTMGPMHQLRQRDYVAALVDSAAAAGAEVRRFGALPEEPEFANGYFLRPSLVLAPSPNHGIVTEEQFGPTLPVLPFDVDSEAIFAANDSWSGLGASVWTKDEGRGVALTSQLQAGCCWINGHGAGYVDHRAPFGGFRSSGMGREFGIEGVREFTDHRAVSIVRSAGH